MDSRKIFVSFLLIPSLLFSQAGNVGVPRKPGVWVDNGTSVSYPRRNVTMGTTCPANMPAGLCANLVFDANSAISIKAFGAIADFGTGNTDNSAAILAAVNFVKNRGGGTVYVPAATACYGVISQTVLNGDSYANITIRGDGYSSCIKALNTISSGGSGIIKFQGTTNYSLKNVGVIGLRISGFDETTAAGTLLSFDNTDGTFVINSYGDTNRNEGFYWNDSAKSKRAYISGNYITRVGGWGCTDGCTLSPRAAYNTNVTELILTENRAFQVGQFIEQTGSIALISNNIFDYTGLNTDTSKGFGILSQSTSSTTFSNVLVLGNYIGHSHSCVKFGANIGGNNIQKNTCNFADFGVILENTTQPDLVSDNYFFDTLALSNGSTILADGNGGATISNNTISVGAVQWANAIKISAVSGTFVVPKNIVNGNVATTAVFTGPSSGPTIEWLHNKIVPGAMGNGVNRYTFIGTAFSKTDLVGIDSEETIFSTTQRKVVVGATPIKGTWAVGDIAIDPAPVAGGNIGSVCTTLGAPGTWKTYGAIAP